MKKLITLFCVYFFFLPFIKAQSCLPGGITFTYQYEIDNFASNYPGCTEIDGPVTIQGPYVYNLQGLSVLTRISNDVTIGVALNLSDFSGLHNLQEIDGYLFIHNSPKFVDFTGLNALRRVGSINIQNNDSLRNFIGLENLTGLLLRQKKPKLIC